MITWDSTKESIFFDSQSGIDTHGGYKQGLTEYNYHLFILLRKIGVISEYPMYGTYFAPASGTYAINHSIEVLGGTQTYSHVKSLKAGEEVAIGFGNRTTISRLY